MSLRRVGAALLGASVALMLSALPASADPATGKIQKDVAQPGPEINLVGTQGSFGTGMPGIEVNGKILSTYCIEFGGQIDADNPDMVEAPWDAYAKPGSSFIANSAKINWILHKSFPVSTIEQLTTQLAENGVTLDPPQEKDDLVLEAVAGTQAAIWHFSDNKDLNPDNPTQTARFDKNVLAIYNFLIGPQNVGLGTQPSPALEINPKTLTGDIGKLIGPFTVATTADKVALKTKVPAGVKITDKDGKELAAAAITDGSEVFFSVPADATPGEGNFELSATAPVAVGRVFLAKDFKTNPDHNQSVIVVTPGDAKVSVSATANWNVAAPPTTTTPPAAQGSTAPVLANTGVSIFVPISLGVLLLLAGGGALLFLRRRGRA
jgi:TQXA domain-containing protein